MARLTKLCVVCGEDFEKPPTCSMRTWTEKRKCCSLDCGNALKRGRQNPKLGDAHRGKRQDEAHVAKRTESIRRTYAQGNVQHARANLGLRREQTSQWKAENIGYRAAHARLYRQRGTPAECELCGTRSGRMEWALKQDAVEVRVESGGRFDGRSYSVAIDDYMSACRSCHRDYDGRERDPATGRYL